ncbi:MAG TPA: flagellar biosynthesis protein FlgN [Desulfonatronum sp.]|nr:flagellar biosynthesis protein FlgN [Desulfonatronum sp.]
MSQPFSENLNRQKQALALLEQLQDEEFGFLSKGDPQSVSQIEFSIQDLLRQLAVERQELKGQIQALDPALPAMRDLPSLVDQADQSMVASLLRDIDQQEQICARKAAQIMETAMALLDQNQALLNFLSAEIKPKNGHTYSQRGTWRHPDGAGALLHGRM